MQFKTSPAIPAPPNNRDTGWPWQSPGQTGGSKVATSVAPLISIIIPSFNQGRFIEETIRSIILQDYESLDVVVIDGGSSDNTLEVIKKYESWLSYWVSERDGGQANAINKGLAVARGEIIKWLNSDDLLLPGALKQLSNAYVSNKDCFFVSPVEHFLDGTNKRRIFKPVNVTHRELVEFWSGRVAWNDPGTFYTRQIIDTVGVINENYRYSFDYEFVLRVSKQCEAIYLEKPAAAFRVHADSKTVAEGEVFIYETARVSQQYWDEVEDVDRRGFQKYFAITMFRNAIRNMVHRPSAALKYFLQGFKTNVISSPAWLFGWTLTMMKSRLSTGDKNGERWSGFGVK